jgi:hypothetical protein
MVAGAQAVWLLSPDERPERLDRPEGLAKDSHWNRKQWAEGLDGAHPGAIEPGSLAEATRTLRDLVGAKKKAEVFQTLSSGKRRSASTMRRPTRGSSLSA